MKHLYLLFLLAVLAWLGSGRTGLLAQEPPRSPLTPPSEETTANPSEPPVPQFMQVEVDLGAGGPNIRLRIHPAWQARYRPSVRVGQARIAPEPEAEYPLYGERMNPLARRPIRRTRGRRALGEIPRTKRQVRSQPGRDGRNDGPDVVRGPGDGDTAHSSARSAF
jgi:hypothetical protein